MPNVSRIAAARAGFRRRAREPKQLVIVIDVAAVRVVARSLTRPGTLLCVQGGRGRRGQWFV